MDPFTWSAAASFAEPIIGGLFGSSSSKKANKAAAAEAQRNRDWQERMSNTAHQREVADLRAAGLNPRLSAMGGSGASSPAGNVAPVIDESTGMARGVSSALESMLARENIKNIKEQNNNLKAQSAASLADADLKRAQTVGAGLNNVITGVDAKIATGPFGELTRGGVTGAINSAGGLAKGLWNAIKPSNLIKPFKPSTWRKK